MADYTPRQGSGIIEALRTRYRDMLDGTHALVVAAEALFGGVVPQMDDTDKLAVSVYYEGAGAPGDTNVSVTDPLPIGDTWAVSVQEDLALADSDKVITVPVGRIWQVLWIWIEFTTDATAPDRQIEVDIRSDTDVIGQIRPNAQQAGSLLRNYMIAPAIANQAAFYDTDHIQTPLPPTVFLPAGWSLRIFDNNAVSVGGDDLLLHLAIASKLL